MGEDLKDVIEEMVFNLRKFRKDFNIEPVPYYFTDGERKIQYIIVIEDTAIYKRASFDILIQYANYLHDVGLDISFDIGLSDPSLVFMKIHASDNVITHFAKIYDVDIYNKGHNFIPDHSINWDFLLTDLTKNYGDVFKRKRGIPTSCEINLVLHQILTDPINDETIPGLGKLFDKGIIKDAFPLHDGTWEWEEKKQDTLNDRQLLSKYWGNLNMWYKKQPINLIAKYFGTEVAFYFAWEEHYIMMLIIVALFGILVLCMNVLNWIFQPPDAIQEICNANDKLMCPLYKTDQSGLVPMSNYCITSSIELILGNYMNILYGIFISVWVTIFWQTWKLKEYTLRVRWNVQNPDVEYRIRYEYKDKCVYKKKSKITGKIEPYLPRGFYVLRYAFTYFIFFITIIVVWLFAIFLIFIKNWMVRIMDSNTEPMPTIWATVFYSISQVVGIKVLSEFVFRLSVWLTTHEVPKTWKCYHDRIIYKIYLFGFINNYIPVLYTAFLKGRLFTHPGDTKTGPLAEDSCLPTGCLLLLGIQLFVIVFLKSWGGNILAGLTRKIERKLIESKHTKTVKKTKMYVPTWEKEYYSETHGLETIPLEFSEMIIQFGYVSFFMSAFPLVGLIALVNNLYELRTDAEKLLQGRRPLPNMTGNIGAWNTIITFASYFSIVCNGFILAFNTNFVESLLFAIMGGVEAETFIQFMFSRFNFSDSPIFNATNGECFYPGQRYPPEDVRKYEKRTDHYQISMWKFLVVILFENVVFMIIGIIQYYLPEMPRRVKEQLRKEKLAIRKEKLNMLERKAKVSKLAL